MNKKSISPVSTPKRLRLGYIREDGRAFVYACGLPICALRRAAENASSAGGREERAQRFGSVTMSFDYNAPRWRRLRAAVLRRDGYLCRYCLRYGRRRQATTVHHIKHADEHPELAYNADNLISLCEACHNKMHPEKAKNAGRYGI